jgi:hypothetical protein
MKPRQLAIIGGLMELAYLSFYFVPESPNEVLLFVGVNAFTFALLTFACEKSRSLNPVRMDSFREPLTPNLEPFLFPKHSNSSLRSELRTILAFAILFRLTLVFHPPVCSDDIYRYVWDGKVAANGVNPFRYAPSDSSLTALHTAELPSKINFPAMRTIYPPLAQGLFFASYKLFGDSTTGLKLLLVLADIFTMFLLLQLCKLYELDKLSTLLLYAWSPLPIMYFGLDGHIDALGVPFLLFCIVLIFRNKKTGGSIALGLAALAKLYPLFIAPFLFRLEHGWRRVVMPALPAIMLAIGCMLYWEPTGGLIESFRVFNTTFEFNGSVFNILYSILESNADAHLVCTLCFVGWIAFVFFLNRPLLEKVFLAYLGFIVFSPVVQPWYFTWLAVLLPLRWSPAVFLLLGLSNISNLVVYEYRMNGTWKDSPLLLAIEYVPFYLMLALEITRGKFKGSFVTVSGAR